MNKYRVKIKKDKPETSNEKKPQSMSIRKKEAKETIESELPPKRCCSLGQKKKECKKQVKNIYKIRIEKVILREFDEKNKKESGKGKPNEEPNVKQDEERRREDNTWVDLIKRERQQSPQRNIFTNIFLANEISFSLVQSKTRLQFFQCNLNTPKPTETWPFQKNYPSPTNNITDDDVEMN
jgi:hypothetical protein